MVKGKCGIGSVRRGTKCIKILKKGDIVISKKEKGYTIVTRGYNIGVSTLWRKLPSDIKGKVISVKKSFYQNLTNVNKITVERISKSPRGKKRLRKKYIIWQNLNTGKIIH